MSLLEALGDRVLRPSGAFGELAGLHLAFDSILASTAYEQAALDEVTLGSTAVAVVGEPGAGKSSLIAFVAEHLPDSHIGVLIRGRTLGDPGDLDHFLDAVLSSGLRAVGATPVQVGKEIDQAAADTVTRSSSPVSIGVKVGGGAIPAELSADLGSLAVEVQREIKDFDRLEAIERLVEACLARGRTPVFVLHDVEAHLGADADDQQITSFFETVVGALVNDIPAASLVAVQDRYVTAPAYHTLLPAMREIRVPKLTDPERDLPAILTHRMGYFGVEAAAADAFNERALLALATAYHEPGGLRRILWIAAEAVAHALDERADQVDAADVHAAIGGLPR